jgi:hypothetical protein
MTFTTLIGNFVGGNLAAAVSARERNDSRAINRDQAPALHLLNGRNRPTASTRLNVPNYEAADVGRWAWGYFGGVGVLVGGVGLLVGGVGLLVGGVGLLVGGLSPCLVSRFS